MTDEASEPRYAFLGRRRTPSSTRPTFVAKDGEQVIEMRSNESQVFPRKNERDFWREAVLQAPL
jgi:hypothetical protein